MTERNPSSNWHQGPICWDLQWTDKGPLRRGQKVLQFERGPCQRSCGPGSQENKCQRDQVHYGALDSRKQEKVNGVHQCKWGLVKIPCSASNKAQNTRQKLQDEKRETQVKIVSYWPGWFWVRYCDWEQRLVNERRRKDQLVSFGTGKCDQCSCR